MSDTVNEFKIGVGIKELLGRTKREQADFLKPIFGEDLEVDEFEGKVYYISLDKDKWQFRYDILFYVFDESETELYSGVSLDEIQEMILTIENKLKVRIGRENIKIFSASWYNGSDEPIMYFTDKWKKELKN